MPEAVKLATRLTDPVASYLSRHISDAHVFLGGRGKEFNGAWESHFRVLFQASYLSIGMEIVQRDDSFSADDVGHIGGGE